MSPEEKKAKTREYGVRYEAKDPAKRKEQKRKAAKRYYVKNTAKHKAATMKCDAARKARDPEMFLEKQRKASEKQRRKKGMKKRIPLTDKQRKEKAYAACRRWVANNPEHVRAYARDWARQDRKDNPEKYAEIDNSRERDPQKRREYNRQYKHSHLRVLSEAEKIRVGTIDFEAYYKTLELFDYKCVYCREAATTIDHIVAIMQGGTNHTTNLIPACKSCNSSKWKRHLGQWLQMPRAKRVLARPYDYEPPQEDSVE